MSFQFAFKQFIDNPEEQGDSVIYYDDNVVIIKDAFPKALRHYLVIPRMKDVTSIHPLDAFHKNYREFTGQELYEMMLKYIEKAKDAMMVSLEIEIFKGKLTKLELDEFRNTFIKVGVHSIPSLKNLHIHVITKDFHSVRLKNKKHFNSFNTDFFVTFDKLNPLLSKKYRQIYSEGSLGNSGGYDSDSHSASDSDDEEEEYVTLQRNETKLEDLIKKTPLCCPYCKESFDFKFAQLKKHLEHEYHKKFDAFA